ncbi:unnamed protein product [Trichogramma brassicae]|uniref:Uncharacterized protein n=1 Tax=Trichogramma brassicae TaxID=86971 RepID=A0A6H5J5Q0_9HYME|nr:unnamed protein product [Trichogramma brassicae]
MKQTCMYCERKLHRIVDVPRAQATSNFCKGDSTYACRTAVYTRISIHDTRAEGERGGKREVVEVAEEEKLVVQQLSLNVAQFNARARVLLREVHRCTDSAHALQYDDACIRARRRAARAPIYKLQYLQSNQISCTRGQGCARLYEDKDQSSGTRALRSATSVKIDEIISTRACQSESSIYVYINAARAKKGAGG